MYCSSVCLYAVNVILLTKMDIVTDCQLNGICSCLIDADPDDDEATGDASEDAQSEQDTDAWSEQQAADEGPEQDQQQQPAAVRRTKRSNKEEEQSVQRQRKRRLVRGDGHVPGLSQQQLGQECVSRDG